MGLFPGLYRHTPIEPVAEPGQRILLGEATVFSLYQVAFIEPLPIGQPMAIDLSNGLGLTAGQQTTIVSLDGQLDMPDGELAQVRYFVGDDIRVSLWQQRGLGRLTTANVQAVATGYSELNDRNESMSEHYIWQKGRSFLQATNPNTYTIPHARVYLYGMRYVLAGGAGTEQDIQGGVLSPINQWRTLRDAVASGEKFTFVPVSGWSR